MNLSELKDLNSGYDEAHRELAKAEQENPCTCSMKAFRRLGGAYYPSLISPSDADPDCELHFPWMIEYDVERINAMRWWMAGYQVGYDTGHSTGEESMMEKLMDFLGIDRDG
jgi:hypothetical protein